MVWIVTIVISKTTYMKKSKNPLAVTEIAHIPNSMSMASPMYNADGIFQPGMIKAEHAAVLFIAAHFQRYGKMPTDQQVQALTEFSIDLFDTFIPVAAERMHEHQADPDNLDQSQNDM